MALGNGKVWMDGQVQPLSAMGSSGDFLGWFHLRPPADGPADEPELGYRLRRAVWGRGYGTEVSRALIDRAFAELGARRVFAQTYQDNVGSRRVMEKAGMTQVRTFRMSPEELVAHHPHLAGTLTVWEGDDVEYAIAREQWARQEAARREGTDAALRSA